MNQSSSGMSRLHNGVGPIRLSKRASLHGTIAHAIHQKKYINRQPSSSQAPYSSAPSTSAAATSVSLSSANRLPPPSSRHAVLINAHFFSILTINLFAACLQC